MAYVVLNSQTLQSHKLGQIIILARACGEEPALSHDGQETGNSKRCQRKIDSYSRIQPPWPASSTWASFPILLSSPRDTIVL